MSFMATWSTIQECQCGGLPSLSPTISERRPPILELELSLTWPQEQKCVRLAKLADHVVVVPVKLLAVALLVLLLPAALLGP